MSRGGVTLTYPRQSKDLGSRILGFTLALLDSTVRNRP